MELKLHEKIKFESLTISLNGGGHKIIMNENGRRNGDLSYAEITLEIPESFSQKFRVYNTKEKENCIKIIEFDIYRVTITEIEWNGNSVKLEIEKH